MITTARQEFEKYYGYSPIPLECVSQLRWSTRRLQFEKPTNRESFFLESRGDNPSDTNMGHPAMLSNPCAMLVNRILIQCDKPKLLKDAVIVFTVGNKLAAEIPLFIFFASNGWLESKALEVFIPPLAMFRVDIHWDKVRRREATIQVVLDGLFLRAIC